MFGIGKNKPSDYEKKMFQMADIFGSEASVPITENRAFRSGMTQLEDRDEKTKKAYDNRQAVTGGTDEANLANRSRSNDNFNRGLQRLLSFAQNEKNRMRGMEMDALSRGENARANRKRQDAANLSSIFDPLSQATSAFTMSQMMGVGGAAGEELSKKAKTQLDIEPAGGWGGL